MRQITVSNNGCFLSALNPLAAFKRTVSTQQGHFLLHRSLSNKCRLTTLRALFARSKAGVSSKQDQSALTLSMKSDRFLFWIAADGEMSIRVHVVGSTLENFRI
jgi:hypothetical protein